jgi:hypothetical protein
MRLVSSATLRVRDHRFWRRFPRHVEDVPDIDEITQRHGWFGFAQELVSDSHVQELGSHQVNGAAMQQRGELPVDPEEIEPGNVTGLKLDAAPKSSRSPGMAR